MRKNFGVKEWLYPMPVLIIGSYDENGIPDAMNAAWGGISDNGEIGISLSADHKTVKNILLKKAFTVSPATAEKVVPCDYVGITSANKVPDKFSKAGFTAIKSEFVDAPLIAELPFALECELISYDEKTSHLFGKIININADESVLDDNGKPDVNKINPIVYDAVTLSYLKLGSFAGKAFSIGAELKK